MNTATPMPTPRAAHMTWNARCPHVTSLMKTGSRKKHEPASARSLKMPTGITGLDEITHGGLPRNCNTVVLGGPGSGKTVLALQTLVNGARNYGEPGIFVAFEENTRRIIRNAASFGWNLPKLERENLFFLDARTRPDKITSGDFDLVGFLATIWAKAKKMRAKRIVFDSIDVLLSLLDNIPKERVEIYRLADWLTESGLTGIITSKLEEGVQPSAQRYGFLSFMADCAVLLRQQTMERISQRELRVLKYRGSAFSENAAPMVIGSTGIDVAHIGGTERTFPVSKQRVTTGVDRLDAMLGGGYFRGSNVLITGAPGTAKSTLCGAFLAAACRRGERALFVSFDESAAEHARNLASVDIDLNAHLASGRLKIYSARTEASSIEEHLVHIQTLIRDHRARCVAFDPLSALFHAGVVRNVHSAAERLLQMTKSRGITTISTSQLASAEVRIDGTASEVATIADTWIHLSYSVLAGERNRALTIVKSRGMKHSNQVRELVLSDQGVTLADVYVASGEVLMGTMRWERETAERTEQELEQVEVGRKQRELKLAAAELNARAAALQRELELNRFEKEALTGKETQRVDELGRHRSDLRLRRSADQKHPGKLDPRCRSNKI
jgi:circadian clock protein KaiC